MSIKIIEGIIRIYKKLYEKNKIKIGNHDFIKLPNGKMLKTYVDSKSHSPNSEDLFFSFGLNGFDFNVRSQDSFVIEVKEKVLDVDKMVETLVEMEKQVDTLVKGERIMVDGKEYILTPVEELESDDIPF